MFEKHQEEPANASSSSLAMAPGAGAVDFTGGGGVPGGPATGGGSDWPNTIIVFLVIAFRFSCTVFMVSTKILIYLKIRTNCPYNRAKLLFRDLIIVI